MYVLGKERKNDLLLVFLSNIMSLFHFEMTCSYAYHVINFMMQIQNCWNKPLGISFVKLYELSDPNENNQSIIDIDIPKKSLTSA